MANVSGLLGTAGGFKGTGVDAPDDWVDSGKLDQANVNLQNQFGNQNSLLQALQAQNGLANQSSVYNQTQGIVNGAGPNPAQAQLAQATQANTANQAALMAGQRGSGANAGLIARQAAQQGAANQQASAGQAATMQANQSLSALGQLSGLANTQVANQIGQTNANQQAAQANQSALLSGNANQNAINSGLIQSTAQQQAAIGGGTISGVGSAMSAGAQGGKVENLPKMALGGIFKDVMALFADGGTVDQSAYQGASKFGAYLNGNVQSVDAGPVQSWGDDLLKNAGSTKPKQKHDDSDAGAANEANMTEASDDSTPMAEGGKIPVLLSPGEKKLTPEQAKAAKEGKIDPIKAGKTIPGKPKVGGAKNDYANDTYKSEEEPGTLILPRSVTQAKNPHWTAMKFVHAHMMTNGGRVGMPVKPKGKK